MEAQSLITKGWIAIFVVDCNNDFADCCSLSKEFNSVIDQGDDADEDDIEGEVDIEEGLAGFVFGAHEEQVLDDDDNDEHRHLILDTLVDKTDCIHTLQTNKKCPSQAHKTSNLEDLSTESLCKTHALLLELDAESLNSLLQVLFLLVVTQGDSEGVEDHRQHVELHIESDCQVESEPHNDTRVGPNPHHRHE